jgi:hypothetical protein
MKAIVAWASILICIGVCSPTVLARVWTDATGRYSLEADLVASNETQAVLKRADHQLGVFPIDRLSQKDRDYIQSNEARERSRKSLTGIQTWTLRDSQKLVGRIVDFTSRDITIQRRRGRIYVNDRPLENLPEFYQQLIPKFVAQSANLKRADKEGLESLLMHQPNNAISLHVDGVVLETESGDEYVVPLSLFADEDQKLLKGGWDEWLASQRGSDYSGQQKNTFLLQSLAAERQRDQQVQQQIALMQLQMQEVQAGLTSLWEVTLYPAAGQGGRPRWVVVPGRNSRQATNTALERNPGYTAGPVRRVAG